MAKAEPAVLLVPLTLAEVGVLISCLGEREDWHEARELDERLSRIRRSAHLGELTRMSQDLPGGYR